MMYKLTKSIYEEPKFRLVVQENKSDHKTQKTGISQGCPLSPYLAVLVMTVMFKDMYATLDTHRHREPIDAMWCAA